MGGQIINSVCNLLIKDRQKYDFHECILLNQSVMIQSKYLIYTHTYAHTCIHTFITHSQTQVYEHFHRPFVKELKLSLKDLDS